MHFSVNSQCLPRFIEFYLCQARDAFPEQEVSTANIYSREHPIDGPTVIQYSILLDIEKIATLGTTPDLYIPFGLLGRFRFLGCLVIARSATRNAMNVQPGRLSQIKPHRRGLNPA